jgi:hypothetical protein
MVFVVESELPNTLFFWDFHLRSSATDSDPQLPNSWEKSLMDLFTFQNQDLQMQSEASEVTADLPLSEVRKG